MWCTLPWIGQWPYLKPTNDTFHVRLIKIKELDVQKGLTTIDYKGATVRIQHTQPDAILPDEILQ